MHNCAILLITRPVLKDFSGDWNRKAGIIEGVNLINVSVTGPDQQSQFK
jgi:hypothetical protein